MKWERANLVVRLISLLIGAAGFGMAWRMTVIGATGEDIPPPFILVAGLVGCVFVALAAIGRYPVPVAGNP